MNALTYLKSFAEMARPRTDPAAPANANEHLGTYPLSCLIRCARWRCTVGPASRLQLAASQKP